jgi:RNA polymerase sporulation-specific sigma factor
VIASQELQALVGCLGTSLSRLESSVLALYLEGRSYEEIGQIVSCDPKAVDNALQRVKRKVGQHLAARNVADA